MRRIYTYHVSPLAAIVVAETRLQGGPARLRLLVTLSSLSRRNLAPRHELASEPRAATSVTPATPRRGGPDVWAGAGLGPRMRSAQVGRKDGVYEDVISHCAHETHKNTIAQRIY